MNNNKGFTLAELLAIVVIIGVIAVITTVNITKQISSSDTEEKNVLSQNIENAAKIYAAKYRAEDLINGKVVDFTLADLVEDGLINLKDNQCKEERDDAIKVLPPYFNYTPITNDGCYKNKNTLENNIKNATYIYIKEKNINSETNFNLNDLIEAELLILEDNQCEEERDDNILVEEDGSFDFSNLSCYTE